MDRLWRGVKVRSKLVTLMLGLASAILVVAACAGSSTAIPTNTPASDTGQTGNTDSPVSLPPVDVDSPSGAFTEIVSSEITVGSEIVPVPPGPVVAGVLLPRSQTTASAIQYNTTQQVGIWVSGRGEITATPDLAILSVGVEARADTVAEARNQAAEAMDGLVQALKDRGIADTDIQTRFFSAGGLYLS